MEKTSLWAKIIQIYQPSLKEENIHITYDLDASGISKSLQLEEEMKVAIQKVEKQTGILEKEVLGDPEKKKILAHALKQDEIWENCFKNICEFFSPGVDPKIASEDIDRPFWNNLQFGFVSDSYESPNYNITSHISHSLLTQLKESTKTKHNIPKLQPVSIVSNVITADKKLVLGHRGGNSYYDVIMSVPAGSVEPHLKPRERGALFSSHDKELNEELALKPEDCESSELIARVEESLLVPGGWQYYVFRTKIKMELDELLEHWKKAIDRKEHRHLVFYDVKDPSIILSTIKYNSFDLSKAGERINQTTLENIGKILPQCSGPILAHFAKQYGPDWAAKTERYLNDHFDLTSCFK